ncbi:MAG: hypothetical protein M0Q43_07465 [Methanothrix sp.]|jgi:hypothetical protein|nr:hypothetical protein [Methanothrix sp.]
MIYKLLPCIAVVACFLLQANALPSAVIGDGRLEFLEDFSDASQKEIDADNSMDNVNVTGAWSINLMGETQELMKLQLVDNDGAISGPGVIITVNDTEKAIANGSIFGDKMNLTVVPLGVPNLYRLNLSLSSLDAGKYTVYRTDGGSRSGNFTFAVSSNIFKPASAVDEWDF